MHELTTTWQACHVCCWHVTDPAVKLTSLEGCGDPSFKAGVGAQKWMPQYVMLRLLNLGNSLWVSPTFSATPAPPPTWIPFPTQRTERGIFSTGLYLLKHCTCQKLNTTAFTLKSPSLRRTRRRQTAPLEPRALSQAIVGA